MTKAHGSTLKKEWPAKVDAFLEGLSQRGIVLDGCEAAHISRRTWYDWLEKYPRLEEAAKQAKEIAYDRAEQKMWELAYEGVTTVSVKGTEYTRYDTTLAIFLAKANRPERFRDEQISDGGGGIEFLWDLPTTDGEPASGRKRLRLRVVPDTAR